jgi:glycosyltransferase involved in cell wall biosynthesis
VSRDTLLIVTTSYPMIADGSEAAGAFVADFAEAMARHMPVRVVGPGLRAGREVGESTLPIWRFAAGEKPLSLLSPSKPWHWPAIYLTLRSLRRQVFAAAEDGRVVHTLALWALPSGWAARELQRTRGVPYSVWALGSDIWSLGKLPIIRRLLRDVCRGASGAYADGLQLAADAEVVSGRTFEFMPSCRRLDGVRTRPLATEPPYRLLFLGRWHPNKGIDLLLDALDSLADAEWTRIQEVHIAGGGPLQSMVHERVARLQAQRRPVRLSGYLDREQASVALAEADRLLLPSRIESIPVVFSDALAFGVPVVSMPVGDIPLLLAGGEGWVASAISAPAFAVVLSECLSNPPDTADISDIAQKFDLDAVAEKLTRRVKHSGEENG